jgi:ATP-dependent helicase YprA (DUF1998 family)
VEHSAQLTGDPGESAFNKVEEYELRFQDIALNGESPVDVLSCTTTMEVGIDIGALSGVAPEMCRPIANYQQRAGRAAAEAFDSFCRDIRPRHVARCASSSNQSR